MRFGVVIFPQAEELDFVGPWEMLSLWKEFGSGPECLLIAERKEPVRCSKGLSILPHLTFEESPELHYLLVPGGIGTRHEVSNPALVGFVARQASHCKAVLSVCSGSFILHAAGLLSGRKATTHWQSLDRLRALGDVDVHEERFVRDGCIWTAGGVSAGIDLTLAFIADAAGEDVAGRIQFASEYYPSDAVYGEYASHQKAPAYVRERPMKASQ